MPATKFMLLILSACAKQGSVRPDSAWHKGEPSHSLEMLPGSLYAKPSKDEWDTSCVHFRPLRSTVVFTSSPRLLHSSTRD